MKIKVKITSKDETIAEATIKNNKWRYIEKYMEKSIALTINSIWKTEYLQMPVKDAYGFVDRELYETSNKIQIEGASVRQYNSLLEFLNYRIKNVKEEFKGGTYDILFKEDGHTFNAVLFGISRRYTEDIIEEISYDEVIAIKVNITIQE